MKKKFKWIICLGVLSGLCLTAAACSAKTMDDEMAEKGYVVSVTYDAGSGEFFSRNGVTIKDYIDPSSYDKDGDGVASIKLMDPEDPARPTSSGSKVSVGKSGYFLAGWYTEREAVLNEDGEFINEEGKVLEEQDDGSWLIVGSDTTSYPAYKYSGYWDFEEDTLEYDPALLKETDGRLSLTLYAGWIPYYEFHYYYKESGKWTLKDTTKFDYQSNLEADTDRNTIWLPTWEDGAMKYTHTYANTTAQYAFPQVSGTTFYKAYTDEACQNEIVGSFVHQGTIDRENCTAVGRVQNIYVEVEVGERYRISSATQLSKNGNANGYYEISQDLDFTDLTWPAVFSTNEFNGKFYTAEGVDSVTISNVSVSIIADSAAYAGLFGALGSTAEMSNISFENITVDIASVTSAHDTSIGLFAGMIDDAAKLTGITVGGTFKVGGFSVSGDWKMNALANGNVAGITKQPIKLEFYGEDLIYYISYTYDPQTIVIDKNGNITFTMGLTIGEDLLLKYEKEY